MSNKVEDIISTSIFNLNGVLEELKCSICLDYLDNPKTLSCQHSYCHKCIAPLINHRRIICPQCKSETPCIDIKYLPKNRIIANLLQNIQSYKANCPQCKIQATLIFCEHCSKMYCKGCINGHIESTMSRLTDKCDYLEGYSKTFDKMKNDIRKTEQDTLMHTIKEMDRLQNEILSVWQSRKLCLIEQINRFYLLKAKSIDESKSVLNNSSNELAQLHKRLDELKKDKNYDMKRMIDSLSDLEKRFHNLENDVNAKIPRIDMDSNELRLVCGKLPTLDIYQDLQQKVYLESTKLDEKLLTDIKEKFHEIKLKSSVFGEKEETLDEKLKELNDIFKSKPANTGLFVFNAEPKPDPIKQKEQKQEDKKENGSRITDRAYRVATLRLPVKHLPKSR